MTQHIDEEMQETEVCEVDPHDCHALLGENLRLRRKCGALVGIIIVLLFHILIFIIARINQ